MAKLKLSTREMILVIASSGVILLYVYYLLLIVPKWDEINRLNNQLTPARIEFKAAQERLKILEKVKGSLKEPRMPGGTKQEKALAAFRYLSYATAQAGLKLVSLKPLLEPNEDRLNFNLACSGKYQNFYEFVKILSKFKVVILIDNLRISGGGDKDPWLDIQMSLTAIL